MLLGFLRVSHPQAAQGDSAVGWASREGVSCPGIDFEAARVLDGAVRSRDGAKREAERSVHLLGIQRVNQSRLRVRRSRTRRGALTPCGWPG